MPASSETIRQLLEEFEHTWQDGAPVEISAFLRQVTQQASPLSADELRELVLALIEVDLEYRWRAWRPAGEDPTLWLLDGYEQQVPQFVRERGWPDSLIIAEFKNRRRWGDRPTVELFLMRFANRRDELLPQLSSIHIEFEGASTTDLPKLPGFDVQEELGRGGFGVVYKAWHPQLSRFVAIKMLNDSAGRSERIVARFAQEAQVIAQLNHPHLLRIHQVGEHQGRPYLVLEYVSGGSLSDKLAQRKLKPLEAAELVAKLADGLEAAHRAEVIHRDLKPQNILFEGDLPKIVDFGLARFGERKHTLTQEVMGTPAYMSPEQAAGNARIITPAADIYSLGVILFQMLAGRRPFEGEPKLILHQILHDLPPRLRSLVPSVPLDLATLCDKCLERDPNARFATAGLLRDELRRFVAGEKIETRPRGLVRRTVRWAQYKPLQATSFGLAAIVLALAIFSGLYYSKFLEADEQRAVAKQAQGVAEDAQHKIAGEQEKTKAALQGEQAARAREQKLLEQIERLGYLRQINVALTMWRENRLPQARSLLQACPEKYRNWEWHYVSGLCQSGGLRLKHESPVHFVAIRPAGDVAATSDNGAIRLWNTQTGLETAQIAIAPNSLQSLAFTPDGEQLFALVEQANKAKLLTWNAADGKPVAVVVLSPPEGARVRAISPDAKRFLTFRTQRPAAYTIRQCDSGESLANWMPSVSGGGKWIAGGKYLLNWGLIDGLALVTSGSDGAEVTRLENRFSGISAADGNERLVVLGFGEGTISVWDLKTGKEIWTHKEGNQMIRSLSVSDDDLFVIGTAGGGVKVFDARLKKEVTSFRGHTATVVSAAITPNGQQFISGSVDKLAVVMDSRAQQEGQQLRAHKAWGLRLRFSPAGKQLITSSIDRSVRIWQADTLAKIAEFTDHAEGINCALVAADNETLYAGCVDGCVHVWNLKDEKRQQIIGPGPNQIAVADLALLDDRGLLVVAYHNNASVVWNLKTLKEEKRLPLAYRFALSPDRSRLALVGATSIQVLSTADWSIQANWHDNPQTVEAVAFLPDGKRLATGGTDHQIKVWDAATGKRLQTLSGHFGNVTCLQVLPGGERLVSGSEDKTVRLWDLITGQEVMILGTHDGAIDDLAVSADGTRIVSASDDGLVKTWQAKETR